MPPPLHVYHKHKRNETPKPKSLREIPAYLKKMIGGFFYRFFYILSLVWETSPLISIALVAMSVLSGVLPVAGAYITAELLDSISATLGLDPVDAGSFSANLKANFSPVFVLLLVNFAYLFLSRILTRLNHMVNSMAGELIIFKIRLKILNKAKTVDLASFDSPEFYEKLENANREAGNRPLRIMDATFQLFSAMITGVSFVVVLAGLHPAAPWLMVLLALPFAVISYIYRNRNFWYMRFHSKERRQMNYYSGVVSNKDNIKELRLMGLSDTFISRYESTFQTYYKGLRHLIVKEGLMQMAMTLLSLVGHCLLFLFVAYSVIYGEGGKLAEYSLYTAALTSISSCVNTVISSTASIYEGTLFIDNMIVFMREEQTVRALAAPAAIPVRGVPHTITFEDVSFRYPNSEKDVISHLSVTFHPGETVVLVGLNGAGKTTLIKLMTRLYDPTEGRILLDGIDLRQYEPKALYSLFGIIFQDFGKYAVSVAENITFGDIEKPVDHERMMASAAHSSAAPFIQDLPDGYDTPLMRIFEENGTELSIGQWQKLSVARAFYKDADILILDEPTASLDALAEQAIYDQFAALSKDKITLLVSHRLSSATTASKIIVLENGKLIEEGTHATLMAQQGAYYTLFTTQAKHYIEPTE